MKSREELETMIANFAITPPSEEELKEYFIKSFEFLKDVTPSEKFDRFCDKQIGKVADEKINAYDIVFAFIRSLFARIK